MRSLLVLVTMLTVFSAGCKTSEAPKCDGKVTGIMQTDGSWTATGNFSGGQPIVQLLVGDKTQEVAASDYTSSSATFDLGNIPSGTYDLLWLLSCDDGSGQTGINGPLSITIP